MKNQKLLAIWHFWLHPVLMMCYLLLGVSTAVAHHLYFYSLHNSEVYIRTRQQWPIRIGAGLAFLTVSLFNMAVSAAYIQYVWTRLRNKTFSLSEIDGLFSLTTNLAGFLSKGILRAKTVALIALAAWILPIATTVPPATLSVSHSLRPFVVSMWVPRLQTDVNPWTGGKTTNQGHPSWEPSEHVRQITSQAAVDGVIGHIPLPALNATYSIEFPGPSLKCIPANEKQQALFRYYSQNTSQSWTTSWRNVSSIDSLLVYNAFSPNYVSNNVLHPQMNRSAALNTTDEQGLQIWIQMPEQNITCLQGFSNFYATFDWVNGIPNHQVTHLDFTTDLRDDIGWKNRVSSAVFASLLDMIEGNITISQTSHLKLEKTGNFMITALRGCEEIVDNLWIRNGLVPKVSKMIKGNSGYGEGGMSASFPATPFLCRNKTLPLSIEDLSNNITMSLLGLAETSQNDTLTYVLFTPSELLYAYEPMDLVLTYAIAGAVSLLAVMFGFVALHENGVPHSLKFSAAMDATRSPELATITGDCGLGMPIDKTAGQTKLRFGLLEGVKEGDSHRVGFVLAEEK